MSSTQKFLSLLTMLSLAGIALCSEMDGVARRAIFAERDGVVAIEAEHFRKQEKTESRHWEYVTSETQHPIPHDGDGPHFLKASGGSYIELLPDNCQSINSKCREGDHISSKGGKMAVLTYKVHFSEGGRYYCWVRAFSTNPMDDGIHLGINGSWPSSSARIGWDTRSKWTWSCQQRSKDGKSLSGRAWIDVKRPGIHSIQLSMMEDGAELDKFILTTKDPRSGDAPKGMGPETVLKLGKLPRVITASRPKLVVKAQVKTEGTHAVIPTGDGILRTREADGSFLILSNDFPVDTPYVRDSKDFIRINPELTKSAEISIRFPYPTNTYSITFMAVGENDGDPNHEILVNNQSVIQFTTPRSQHTIEMGDRYNVTSAPVRIRRGDVLTVRSKIPKHYDYSHARWVGLKFHRAR